MATPATMATATTNGHPLEFPGAKLVQNIRSQALSSHVRTLTRLANLSVPVVDPTATSSSIDNTIDEIRTHAKTTSIFGEILAGAQKKQLTREELDLKLLNWAMEVPGLREKFDELPENVRQCVDEFRTGNGVPSAKGFKIPPNLATAKKNAALKAAWDGHVNAGEKDKYPTVVENTGEPVAFVEKLGFENWGQTSRSNPAVHPIMIV